MSLIISRLYGESSQNRVILPYLPSLISKEGRIVLWHIYNLFYSGEIIAYFRV